MGKAKGTVIHKLVKDTSMSVTEWAKANGFSQTTVSSWINEKREIKYKSAVKLAKALHVSVDVISSYPHPYEKYDDVEDRCAWICGLPYNEYSEIVNAYGEKRLNPFDIAKGEDIENFRDRAIVAVSRLDIPADAKGKVVSLLSDMDLFPTDPPEKNNN